MEHLFVGVGQVTLGIRHAQSLKDKRRVVQSIVQKLRNEGFSVTENGYKDQPKRAILGFAYAGASSGWVEERLSKAKSLFFGDFDILDANTDIIEYEQEPAAELPDDFER